MARKVKCFDTGEYSTSDVAYKVDDRYFSSEAAYEAYKIQDLLRLECAYVLGDYLGYVRTMKLPTYLYRRLKELHEQYEYDAILATIKGERDNILWALNKKDFENDTRALAYIFAILQNHINKYVKTIERQKKLEAKEKSKEEHRELYEEIPQAQIAQKKDLSTFIGSRL